MIKRPLNARFRDAVLRDEKTTTIRDKPWPVGVPIMLYNWAGAPYRSKQIDVAPIVVIGFWTIYITRREDDMMLYHFGRVSILPLHETEGFESRGDMDDWFRPLVKPGQTITKAIIKIRRIHEN
jgi:hypothetical protein